MQILPITTQSIRLVVHKCIQKINDYLLHAHVFAFSIIVIIFAFFFFAGGLVLANDQVLSPNDSHLVDLLVDGKQTSIPTRAATVGELLAKTNTTLHTGDIVEPVAATPIDADNFRVQVYRARPIIITDGTSTKNILTAQTSAPLIAKQAGFATYPEDVLTITTADNFSQDNVLGEKLTIKKATPITISIYGAPAAQYRTHQQTVGEVLKEQHIVPEQGATVTPNLTATITQNMAIFVTKFGKKIVVSEQDVPFDIQSTPDPTKANGVTTITTPGVKGKKQIVYEVEMQGSKEISRSKIQEVITVLPQTQQQTRGTKPGTGLSKAKSAGVFIDSKGVLHRETYYDLPMSSAMRSCNAGGQYSVRADGAKIDKDGYVIVAANLKIYPRCTVVETSIGAGKVYDTGGFALVQPYQFDLATDWSNNDGR